MYIFFTQKAVVWFSRLFGFFLVLSLFSIQIKSTCSKKKPQDQIEICFPNIILSERVSRIWLNNTTCNAKFYCLVTHTLQYYRFYYLLNILKKISHAYLKEIKLKWIFQLFLIYMSSHFTQKTWQQIFNEKFWFVLIFFFFLPFQF